jgi:hypothetical protein
MKKVLYQKNYESQVYYGYKPEHKIKSYIKVTMNFSIKDGLWFSVDIPNVSYGNRNPIKAFLQALEHESIGMAKYNRLKEDVRSKGYKMNI